MNITTASAENISEVVFMKKDKSKKEVKNSKKIIGSNACHDYGIEPCGIW